ncbi:MAG: hypothetical protein QME61_04285 [Patescibacteria group bacterium]|nr:hypothetical protein [Patescibacteria group bacterium]
MTIDKIREKYKDENLNTVLIKLKNLELFLKLRTLTSNEKEVVKLKNEMENKLKNLKLKRITTGYCGLYWRKYNFDKLLKK